MCVRVFSASGEATKRDGCSEVRTFHLRCEDAKTGKRTVSGRDNGVTNGSGAGSNLLKNRKSQG